MTSRSGQDFTRKRDIFHFTYFSQSNIPFKASVFVFGPLLERPFLVSEKEIYNFKQLFVTENKFYLSFCCFLFKMLTTMTKFIFEMS